MNKKITQAIDNYNNQGFKKEFYNWLESFCFDNPSDTIYYSACSIRNKDKKKHPHQWNISNKTLKKFAKKLSTTKISNEIMNIRKFTELYNFIEKNKVKGIGLLACYDTALRIAYFNKINIKDVYLQSGSKIGARIVLKKQRLPRKISKQELLTLFNTLQPAIEIEDILCIYKDFFAGTKKLSQIKCC